MKIGSLFDGIGGWPLAAVKFGAIPVWASEIEAFPIKVTQRHFPNMKHLGDITGVHGYDVEPVDVICMGSPCQDLSVAGKREGLAGARSGLFMDAVRIVREMREATNGKYPRFVVWENVPGAFSSNKGNDFRAVLEEITETEIPIPKSGRWATAGMVRSNGCEVAWRTLDAQYWGVPQRRKRIFLVADFGGGCAGEVLFKPESVSRYSAQSRGEGKGIAGSVTDRIRTPIWDIGDRRRVSESIDISPTLLSKMGTGGNNVPIVTNGTRAAGFKPRNSAKAYGIGYTKEQAPTLSTAQNEAVMVWNTKPIPINDKATRYKGGGKGYVAIWDMTHADEVMRPVKDGIVPTLNARMGTGGNQVPVIQEPVCLDIANPRSNPTYNIAPTLCARMGTGGNQVPVIHCKPYCIGNGQVDQAKLSEKVGALNCMHDQQAVMNDYKVRRLTPTECERLQGLPDGYTYGGSDSARYKALGNGMAQPCADFVMQRIVEVSAMKDRMAEMGAHG